MFEVIHYEEFMIQKSYIVLPFQLLSLSIIALVTILPVWLSSIANIALIDEIKNSKYTKYPTIDCHTISLIPKVHTLTFTVINT